jgi:hypothetical protein
VFPEQYPAVPAFVALAALPAVFPEQYPAVVAYVALPAFVALAALPAVLPEQYPAVPAYVAFVALAALPDVFAALFGMSPDASARNEGAPDPDVGPAKTKLFDVDVAPVPPFPIGKVPETSVVKETAPQLGVVPL